MVLLHTVTLYSQKQGNIWYFGGDSSNQGEPGAGLDFNSDSPIPLTNSIMGYTEGSATYCNSLGQLLFYAKGDSVFDRSHKLMLNGDSLGGHWSTQQSALIVPVTGDTNKYYLFTNSGYPTSPGAGLHYSIIDMTLNGGLGAITLKAVTLLPSTGEQLTGTKHGNGIDFWVLTTDYASCRFYAYQVTSKGVSSPVISDLGYNAEGYNNMVISPNGDKIAMKAGPLATLSRVLFDFDNSTGIVSNPYPLIPDNANSGCVFSPDGTLFYDIQSFLGPDSLIQYDLTASNILASMKVIASISNEWRADMKVGPDGKIYIPKRKSSLDVINDPNVIGTGCNYQPNAVTLSGRLSGFHLPNITLIAEHDKSNESQPAEISWDIYPNPFRGYTVIRIKEVENMNLSLRIFDRIGRQIRMENIGAVNEIRIEREDLTSGLYFFQISSDGNIIAAGKMIIE